MQGTLKKLDNIEKKIDNLPEEIKRSGYRVDNLGLPTWVVKKAKELYPDCSIHYAIQQILKQALKD